MTTSYKPPKAGASVTFLSSAVKAGQRNTHKINSNHHNLLVAAGANRGGKRRKRKKGWTQKRRVEILWM